MATEDSVHDNRPETPDGPDVLVGGRSPGSADIRVAGSKTDVLAPPPSGSVEVRIAGEDPSPVFVDSSGRRARVVRRLGVGASVALAAYLAAVGVSLVAGAEVPLTPWTGGSGETAPDDDGPDRRRPGGPDAARLGGAGVASPGVPQPSAGTRPGGTGPGGSPAPAPSGSRRPNGPGVSPTGGPALPPPAPSGTVVPTPTSPGKAPTTPPRRGGRDPKGKRTS
ncbi:hypothetical protein [Thermomonospora umbrina]|uniref:hypothetical protein n=1 Tax=Thermomonospora umbrina TaxID=111806 RepID=UPI0011C12F06|nr:hypothetical protein [Thermomonospora umbrina]